MQRVEKSFVVNDIETFKKNMLHWVQKYSEYQFLDSNKHQSKYKSFENLLAFDALTVLQSDYYNAFDALTAYQNNTNDWLFGYLSYDLKNDIENIDSQNIDNLKFSDIYFFQPKKIIFINNHQITFSYLAMCDNDIENDFDEILKFDYFSFIKRPNINIKERVSLQEYKEGFEKIKKHIHRGDIYELNYCIEFFAEDVEINPLQTYIDLNKISTPPFACICKYNHQYVISASPERYLKKVNQKIISQPIKGTAKRSADAQEDDQLKAALRNNLKEQAENVMIVDLVRNDLSKTATKGSVHVEELFGIYSFKQVHQMISTVVSEVKPNENPVNIIKSTFPMGSMTGAPKLSAMKIIEKVEKTKRSLYSGAIGYFTPNNDFDFNVVIRSILYNSKNKYLSFSVGSAITIDADADSEYNECLLKAQAMKTILTLC